jgi:hypothetical protein
MGDATKGDATKVAIVDALTHGTVMVAADGKISWHILCKTSAHSMGMNEVPEPSRCTRGEGTGTPNGRSMRQGSFASVKARISSAGTLIATYETSGDPLTRYDRRRFQLVTPSRVASGGVFVSGASATIRSS